MTALFQPAPKPGAAPAPPPPPPAAPTMADSAVQGAGSATRKDPNSGVNSTSPGGLTTEATTARKSLLGQ